MSQLYQGVPREDIPWFPLIDPERCDHCLKCLEFCPHDVYERSRASWRWPTPSTARWLLALSVGLPQKAIAFMSPRDLGMMLQMLRRQRADSCKRLKWSPLSLRQAQVSGSGYRRGGLVEP
jgi:hypothetical protein